MDAKRDWGHARDYVDMQWLMLQQDQPEDFVIATGVQYSVRDFINAAAKELGMTIRWEGEGVNEKGYWLPPSPASGGGAGGEGQRGSEATRQSTPTPSLRGGEADAAIQKTVIASEARQSSPQPIVAVDPRYFRPTEVETLLGDPAKAKAKLGWVPRITFDELVAEMVREDLKSAELDELIKKHGYKAMDYHE